MTPRIHSGSICAAALLAALAAAPALAQQPAALLLESPGGIEPKLPAFAEVSAGTDLALAEGQRLVFVHYRTCRAVTVVGGKVRIEQGRYDVAGGRIVSEQPQNCPRQIRLAESAGTAGALVMRGGGGGALKLATAPALTVVGPRAGRFSLAQFLKDETVVAELPIVDRRLSWPVGQKPLTSGEEYRLVIQGHGVEALEQSFVAADGQKDGLVLLRVD